MTVEAAKNYLFESDIRQLFELFGILFFVIGVFLLSIPFGFISAGLIMFFASHQPAPKSDSNKRGSTQ